MSRHECIICGDVISGAASGMFRPGAQRGDVPDGWAHPDCTHQEFREVRPCTKCGYSRRVKVVRQTRFRDAVGEPTPFDLYSHWCTACEMEEAEKRHAQMAARLSDKAAAIRRKRRAAR